MRVSKSIRRLSVGLGVTALALVAVGVGPAFAQDASPNPSEPTVYVIAPSLTDPVLDHRAERRQPGRQGLRRQRHLPGTCPGHRRRGHGDHGRGGDRREAGRHRDRLHQQGHGGGHHRGARRGHPGRALQQQPLRGRQRAGRRAHPEPVVLWPGREHLGRDPCGPLGQQPGDARLQGADRQPVPDRVRADLAR